MGRLEYRHLTLRGVKINYAKAGAGPAVLLLHGLGTSSVTWWRNIEAFADAGYTVLAPDLPGHGDSDKPGHLGYDPVAGARLIHEFLGALDVERVSLVGNSAGGLVAGLFALDHPRQVERLVLVSSGGLGRDVSWFLRIVSLPALGELMYHRRQSRILGVGKKVFYRTPANLDDLLTESSRIGPSLGQGRPRPGHPLQHQPFRTEETTTDFGQVTRAGGTYPGCLGYRGQIYPGCPRLRHQPGASP